MIRNPVFAATAGIVAFSTWGTQTAHAQLTYDSAHATNAWDLTTTNWLNAVPASVAWTNGSQAVFGGTAETVDINVGITTPSITFQSNGYVLQDADSNGTLSVDAVTVSTAGHTATIAENLTGGPLVKNGAGVLALSGTNTYTGGTTVNAGALRAGSAGAAQGNVTVASGATLDLSGREWPTGAVITVSGGGASGFVGALTNTSGTESGVGALTLSGNSTIGTSNNKLNLRGTITGNGNTLTIAGTGETNLRSGASFVNLPAINVTSGLLRFESSQTPASPMTLTVQAGAKVDSWGTQNQGANLNVVLNGGTLESNNNSANWYGTVTAAAPSTINTNSRMDLRGAVNGSGSITKTGSNLLAIRGGVSGLSGITINNGQIRAEDTGFGSYTGTVTANSGTVLSGWGNNTINPNVVLNSAELRTENNGTNTFTGAIQANGTSTLNADNSGTLNLQGAISGSGSFSKINNGTVRLSGNNSGFSGNINVVAGVLIANNTTSATGSGNVTVQNGATLGGLGSVGGTSSLLGGGRLAPGDPTSVLGVGSLTLNQLSLANESRADFQLKGTTLNIGASSPMSLLVDPSATHTGNLHDFASVSGSVTPAGLLLLSLDLTGYTAKQGDVFDLFDFGSGLMGNVAVSVTAGSVGPYRFDTSRFSQLGVLVVVPEPGRMLLLLAGLVPLLRRRRVS